MLQELFDHLSYVSYRTQRDAGITAEICANRTKYNGKFEILIHWTS